MKKQPRLAAKTVDTIENIAGKFPGYRRAHAKGIAFEAIFSPNGAAAPYTTAAHLQQEEVSAIVRFSHSSPNPALADILSPVKGMAVQFQLPNGGVTSLATATVPVFIVKTPEAFDDIMSVFKKGNSSLKETAAILTKYPDFKAGYKILKNLRPPESFATGRYFSIHAYYFLNGSGERQAIKYEWEPAGGVQLLSAAKAVASEPNTMEDDIENRVSSEPIVFHLNIQLGEEGDPTDDPTKEWPKERRKITVGHLSIVRKLADNAEDKLFDPTVVPNGIECSKDPVLLFRHDAYAVSHQRRKEERS